jgi:hypothetical protein
MKFFLETIAIWLVNGKKFVIWLNKIALKPLHVRDASDARGHDSIYLGLIADAASSLAELAMRSGGVPHPKTNFRQRA